eukprot:scaffold348578_cov21-Prasinocladus_malaysianus.AAC.2
MSNDLSLFCLSARYWLPGPARFDAEPWSKLDRIRGRERSPWAVASRDRLRLCYGWRPIRIATVESWDLYSEQMGNKLRTDIDILR